MFNGVDMLDGKRDGGMFVGFIWMCIVMVGVAYD
jgi:hypothetical protein